jgi:AraC-like DNA-binding protein
MDRFVVNPRWSDLPHVHALLHGFPRDYHVHDYRTTLSLKSVAAGSARYATPSGRYLVTPDRFLVLNHGQRYAMEVDADAGAETVCPFFAPGFVDAAARSAAATDALQLDDIDAPAAGFELIERLHPLAGPIGRILGELRDAVRARRAGAAWLEDRFHDLALALAALRDDARREVDTFPGVRRATREELYRRLHRARDFLVSCYAEPLTVAQVARVAALAPFHFHRTFRRAFGRTPMQLLQHHRLEVARALLARGDSVTDVARAVGFDSLGSFSWLFRRKHGVRPSDVRPQKGRTEEARRPRRP